MRTLAGLLLTAGVAAAKPPAPVDGVEPPPVAREFHDPAVVRAGYRPTPTAPPKAVPIAEWFDRVGGAVRGPFVVPLGPVIVRPSGR